MEESFDNHLSILTKHHVYQIQIRGIESIDFAVSQKKYLKE